MLPLFSSVTGAMQSRPEPVLSQLCASPRSPKVAESPMRRGAVPVILCSRSSKQSTWMPRESRMKWCTSSMIT